jgi:hypothetical protein
MYKPSRWFVALGTLLLTVALLAGKTHLLVPVAGSGILLGYGWSVVRRRKQASRPHPGSPEAEVMQVEKQRYLLAKEALLDGAKRKRRQLRKQQ